MVYDSQLWITVGQVPSEIHIRNILGPDKSPVVIDLEHKDFQPYLDWNPPVGTKPRAVYLDTMLRIIRLIRNVAPERSVGWFGWPFRQWSSVHGPLNWYYNRYVSKMRGLIPIVDSVDFVCADFYWRNNKSESLPDWEAKNLGMMEVAKKLTTKPIVAFISPLTVDGEETFYTKEQFQSMMDKASIADGIGVWNNWKNTSEWSESLPFVSVMR